MLPQLTPPHIRFNNAFAGDFDPTWLSDLLAWWDFSDINTLYQDASKTTPVTAANDPIGAVVDKSPNGYDIVVTNNNYRPLFKTGVLGTKSGALFDDTDDRLEIAQTLSTQAAGTWILTAKFPNTVDRSTMLSAADGSESAELQSIEYYSTLIRFFHVFGGQQDRVQTDHGQSANTPMIIVYKSSGTLWSCRINGADKVLSEAAGTNSGDWYDVIDGIDKWVVGGEGDTGSGNHFDGHLGDVIMYDRELNATEVGQVEAYLSDKYGITLS